MIGKYTTLYILIFLNLANFAFAKSFYSQKRSYRDSTYETIGDLDFSYSKKNYTSFSHEIIEQELTRLIIERYYKKYSLLTIEKKKSKMVFYILFTKKIILGGKLKKYRFALTQYVLKILLMMNASCRH